MLRTERLLLRQITESDGPALFDIFSDDQVTAHYAWDTFTSIEQGHELAERTARAFRERESLRWGLDPARLRADRRYLRLHPVERGEPVRDARL